MASEIKVDTISEKTSAGGVTIDSLSIKDGGLVAAGNIDVNGNNLVLDANANTYLDAGTDDTIKVYVSGAEDLRIGANAINVLSGTTLTIDSGATITNSGTANGFGSSDPSSADGDTLGTASAEWSDLYLADGGVIYFGNDQEITLTHNADDGLLLKHVGTGDGKEPSLTFQAGDNDIAQDDVLGSIFFQAPDEGAGTDAVLVAAGIEAVSEGDFSSSNNATKLSFKTAASEAASEKMSLSSAGLLTVANGLTLSDGDVTVASGHGISFAATSDASGMASEVLDDYEEGTFTISLETGSGNAQANTSYNLGAYTKIGRMVTVSGYCELATCSSPSGLVKLHTLPFATPAGSEGTHYSSGSISFYNMTGALSELPTLYVDNSVTHARIRDIFNSTSDDIANHFQQGCGIRFCLTYLAS